MALKQSVAATVLAEKPEAMLIRFEASPSRRSDVSVEIVVLAADEKELSADVSDSPFHDSRTSMSLIPVKTNLRES